jgi:hypothetical protein
MPKRERQYEDDDGREEENSPRNKVRISTADEVFFIESNENPKPNRTYPTEITKTPAKRIEEIKKKFEQYKYSVLNRLLNLENDDRNGHNYTTAELDEYFSEIMNKAKGGNSEYKNTFIKYFNNYLNSYNGRKMHKYICLSSEKYPTVLYVGIFYGQLSPYKQNEYSTQNIERLLNLPGSNNFFGFRFTTYHQPVYVVPQILYDIKYFNRSISENDELMRHVPNVGEWMTKPENITAGKKSRRKGKSNKNTKSKKHKLTYKSKKTNKSKTRKTNK